MNLRPSPTNARPAGSFQGYLREELWPLAYMYRFSLVIIVLVLTFINDWTQMIVHPIDSFFIFVVYPFEHFIVVVISVFSRLFWGEYLNRTIRTYSTKYFGGVNWANWYDPTIFETADMPQWLEELREPLSTKMISKHHGTSREEASAKLAFLKRALPLLVLSALMYEPPHRQDAILRDWKLNGRKVALQQGQFALLVYPDSGAWIVLTFKGTNPALIDDLWLDACELKAVATRWLFGNVHGGFYRTLFEPDPNDPLTRTSYEKIVDELKVVVQETNARSPLLWLTGHSLGGALSTLFFARWAKAPTDFQSLGTMASGITFGTPRVGNRDFAEKLAGKMRSSLQRSEAVSLIKVRNGNDFITHLPMGSDHPPITVLPVSKQSIIDFVHAGQLFCMHNPGGRSHPTKTAFASDNNTADPVVVAYRALQDMVVGLRDMVNHFRVALAHPERSQRILLLITPYFVADHMTGRYYQNMKNAINAEEAVLQRRGQR